jgi:branched-chain amino acid transport system substrate-binding protein
MRKAYVAAILVTIVAAAFFLDTSPSWAQKKGPIKIGFIAPVSGPFAQVGKDMLDGIKLYLEEIGYQAAGRNIELLVEDDEGIPATTLMKGRKLVEKDGVHVVGGVYLTPCGYALAPYIDSKQIPAVLNSGGDDLTQRQRPKWVIRTSTTSSQPMHPFGEYAYKVMKLRKISVFCPDFAFSWEAVGGFQRVFEENGGKVIQKIWFPMITQDFSPYFSQISKEADALYIILGGAFTIKFFKQFEEFGLKGKMPLIGMGTTTDESTLPGMDDEIIGVITALHYSAAIDNPVNKKFVKAFRERANNKPPSFYAEASYTSARWIAEGIKVVQGDVENRGKFLDALRKTELKDVPRGPMKIDAYGNPIQNIYVRKVERVGGELQNTVIYTYPNISQFWTYKPEEYLKQPIYPRDYSPGKP